MVLSTYVHDALEALIPPGNFLPAPGISIKNHLCSLNHTTSLFPDSDLITLLHIASVHHGSLRYSFCCASHQFHYGSLTSLFCCTSYRFITETHCQFNTFNIRCGNKAYNCGVVYGPSAYIATLTCRGTIQQRIFQGNLSARPRGAHHPALLYVTVGRILGGRGSCVFACLRSLQAEQMEARCHGLINHGQVYHRDHRWVFCSEVATVARGGWEKWLKRSRIFTRLVKV